ncbi:UDP-N-acetylglucosamine 2-epimerase (non-hydrolyzing) [bacterium]|nr:UDP-N-acetylglucosamine 2-epimerase (non-hydrolyzing) [bacterium]MBU1615197.1 UDP-N-acetylglucosamine 2-epimerase (non-hydrolyzing) [bacterium]
MKVFLVAGARPNFMKIAPIWEEMKRYPDEIEPLIIHTGQHYDDVMSKVFFEDLSLPEPDIYLGVGSGSHAVQTAKIMIEFEKVLLEEQPDLIMVVGDVNSTLACSLVASKLLVPVAHVEAGLRSFDRTMPEEINRLVTDSLSNYLFTTCEDANENLNREGIPDEKIFFVGNTMVDTLLRFRDKYDSTSILSQMKVKKEGYALLTLHRPSNVDDERNFTSILDALEEIQARIKIIFPAHPRTRKQIKNLELEEKFADMQNLILVEPLGYLDFMSLLANSKFVLTDSGGIQEETTVLGIPCLTLRENTERPITVKEGTNVIVGVDKEKIVEESRNILNGNSKTGKTPKFWDGKAAQRIVKILRRKL